MSDRLRLLIVTEGGLGLLPGAKGTWGSIPPALLALGMLLGGASPAAYHATLVVVVVVSSVLCIALTPWAERRFNQTDAREIVVDEVAGQALALLAAPAAAYGAGWEGAVFVLVGFALFRVLDAAKPWPICSLQELPAGWGVLADDLAAGAATLGIALLGWSFLGSG